MCNDVEYLGLPSQKYIAFKIGNNSYFKVKEKVILNCNDISQYYCFFVLIK